MPQTNAVFNSTESRFSFIVNPNLDSLVNRVVWMCGCCRKWRHLFVYVCDIAVLLMNPHQNGQIHWIQFKSGFGFVRIRQIKYSLNCLYAFASDVHERDSVLWSFLCSYAKNLCTRCLTNHLWRFHQIYTWCAVGDKDWLVRFLGQEVRIHSRNETAYCQKSPVLECIFPAKASSCNFAKQQWSWTIFLSEKLVIIPVTLSNRGVA